MGVWSRWSWVGALLALGVAACGQVPPNHPTELAIEGQSCFDCHGDRYLATTDPDHVTLGYPRTCDSCHATEAWRPASNGNHDFWPLTGAHEVAACESCHADGYVGTPTQCSGCHLPEYEATTDPDHVASGFATSCETCHGTAAWTPATFDHDQFWPIRGKHETVACTTCHAGGVYEGTPRDCAGCHLPDYQATTDSNHVAEQFPTTCEACHSENGWSPAAYDHDQYWPLEGRHATTSCESCHVGGVYAGTPRTCDGCHHPDYVATTSPAHSQVGIPTSCDDCHTPANWATDEFPQHNALFPITNGDHSRFSCNECHITAAGYSEFTCTGCHTGEHNLNKMNSEHLGEVGNYQSTLNQYGIDGGCLHCHPDGREHDD